MKIKKGKLWAHLATILLAVVSLSLGACGTDHISTASVCPVPKEYSQPFMIQAANEREKLPPESAVGALVDDYGAERNELRAIQKTETP